MDPFFGPPYIDRDEWREFPRRHRYVHGGFEGTDTRFSFYFPDRSQYDGRFLHFLQGGLGGKENQAQLFGGLDIAFSNGAYLVESNQGHVGRDPLGLQADLPGMRGGISILAYRASTQAARFAREVAREMYGSFPAHGYVFGGSGGATRSASCLENAPDLYDGAVPFMFGFGGFVVHNPSILAMAESVLGGKLPAIVDAVEPGGTGDPFAVLDTDEERAALGALYRAGFPRGAEVLVGQAPMWLFWMQRVREADPGFFDDFWSVEGYAGTDPASGAAKRRVEEKAVVRRVVRAEDIPGYATPSDDINVVVLFRRRGDAPVGVILDGSRSEGRVLVGARMRFMSGAAAGREVICSGAIEDVLFASFDTVDFEGVAPGDEVLLDNGDALAFGYYHRHVAEADHREMRQFFIDGKRLHPKRRFPQPADVGLPTGRFSGKMILLQHAQDRECWPNGADAYACAVRSHLGDAADDHFRLWWLENAAHFVPVTKPGRTRFINYAGCAAQAVRDVIDWVERDREPPRSTGYTIEESSRLALASDARERGGIQPVLTATANGGSVAHVAVGEAVRLAGSAHMPPNAGSIVRAEWDFEGSGTWPARSDGAPVPDQSFETTHAYERPGTYFATFRAAAHREGSERPGLRLVQNLARVRVVVR